MHVNVLTNAGNALAIEKLLVQGGANIEDLKDHVVIVHGDLGSGEHLDNIQISQSIEETPFNRLQHVLFVPGFLHIEMAMTDAIWRIYLQGKDPESIKSMDASSIFHLCGLAWPRDAKKLATGPNH